MLSFSKELPYKPKHRKLNLKNFQINCQELKGSYRVTMDAGMQNGGTSAFWSRFLIGL